MKILIVTDIIGRTAPGIVFERLVSELSKKHEIECYCTECSPSIDISQNVIVNIIPNIRVHPRISRVLIQILKINVLDYFWARKCSRKIHDSYDFVFSLISSCHCNGLVAGNMLAAKYQYKHACYSVDAIPAPLGWSMNNQYYYSLQHFIKNHLSKVDFFASSNEKMLEYQLSTFQPKKGLMSDVIYTPSPPSALNYPLSDNMLFLYTGGIYGVRKVNYMLRAFKLLLNEYPYAKLRFVGTVIAPKQLSMFTEQERRNIEILPFVRDLSHHYSQAIALLDIDADLADDIFLSSKIVSYIKINRPIICETGINSPSRLIFNGIPSILQCGHSDYELYLAMSTVVRNISNYNYSDRDGVLNKFELSTILNLLNESLVKMIKKPISSTFE